MRLFLAVLFSLVLADVAYADKLIMVCTDVNGQRVDFVHDTKEFEEGKDGFSNAKHVFLFDDKTPKVLSAKWQAALLDDFNSAGARERVDKIVGIKFTDEVIVRRVGMKFITVSGSENNVFTTLYDFENEVVLATRISANGIGSDVAAYYKGRCERIS